MITKNKTSTVHPFGNTQQKKIPLFYIKKWNNSSGMRTTIQECVCVHVCTVSLGYLELRDGLKNVKCKNCMIHIVRLPS